MRLSRGDSRPHDALRRRTDSLPARRQAWLSYAFTMGQTCIRFAPTADFFATLLNVSTKLRRFHQVGRGTRRVRLGPESTSCPTGGRGATPGDRALGGVEWNAGRHQLSTRHKRRGLVGWPSDQHRSQDRASGRRYHMRKYKRVRPLLIMEGQMEDHHDGRGSAGSGSCWRSWRSSWSSRD
jgi:hypothetical protein